MSECLGVTGAIGMSPFVEVITKEEIPRALHQDLLEKEKSFFKK